MAETDFELQLKVWKELAVSKQMLIRAATDALKLDPDCTQQEFKVALEAAIKRAADADSKAAKAQDQAKTAVAEVEKKLAASQKSLSVAEAAHAEALANQQKLQQQIADMRAHAANETKNLKELLAEKERALKAINTALSDTPENVVKKLKALKKQKMDESDARRQAEDNAAALRKDKNKLEQTVKDMQAAQDNAAQLATRYRELHAACESLHDQLATLVEDKKTLTALPLLDVALIEGIEKVGAPEAKKTAAKGRR